MNKLSLSSWVRGSVGPWVRLPAAALLGLIAVSAVRAECVLNRPKFFAQAVADQPPLGDASIGCPPPPGDPCTKPAAPTLSGSALASEVQVQGTIPSGYSAVLSYWRVTVDNSGHEGDFYESKSKEAVDDKSGSTVTYGLPGLRKGGKHYVRVGFCQDIAGYPGPKGCNCWSEPLTIDMSTSFRDSAATDKPVGAPPISGVAQKLEDHFKRPATGAQTTPAEGGNGDGVGPNAVWEDGFDGATPDNSYIGSDNDSAVVANGLIRFVPEAKSTDAYGAIRFWTTNTTGGAVDNYNIEVAGRYTGAGAGTEFFAAKLVYKQLGITDYPVLALVSEDQMDPATGSINRAGLLKGTDYINITETGTSATCPGQSTDKCTAVPPLTAGTSRETNAVVLQISTVRNLTTDKTDLVAAPAWDCPTSGSSSVYDCNVVCCLQKSDNDQTKLETKGRWFVFAHHTGVQHKLEWFKVGDTSTGVWP